MSKNRLGLRRSGGGGGKTGLGLRRAGSGLAPGADLKRPYLPDAPQDNARDSSKTGRVSGLRGKKK
jgi:hypothetical protein